MTVTPPLVPVQPAPATDSNQFSGVASVIVYGWLGTTSVNSWTLASFIGKVAGDRPPEAANENPVGSPTGTVFFLIVIVASFVSVIVQFATWPGTRVDLPSAAQSPPNAPADQPAGTASSTS